MGQLFTYSLISSLALLFMYLIYRWMLADRNRSGFNRGVLLSIYAASLAIPFLPSLTAYGSSGAATVEIEGIMAGQIAEGLETTGNDSVLSWLLIIYASGIALTLIHTAIVATRLFRFASKGERIKLSEGFTIVLTDDTSVAPFSWCNYLVVNRDDYEQWGRIICCHELSHLRSRHWLDLLLAQGVIALQWYNPAAWLMREELRTVHEYQADLSVIESGVDVEKYQMLLIKKAVGARFPSLANSLNHSQLKKRVTMMYKKQFSVGRRFCGLALIPAAALALAAVNVPAVASMLTDASKAEITLSESKVSEKTSESGTTKKATQVEVDGKVYEIAEVMPEYEGGMMGLLHFIQLNIKYPKEAQDAKAQGKAVVQFVVTSTGKVADAQIKKSAGNEYLDAEAIRVVSSIPNFTPGKVDGKAVNCYYTIPITFKLQKDEPKTASDKEVKVISYK